MHTICHVHYLDMMNLCCRELDTRLSTVGAEENGFSGLFTVSDTFCVAVV